MRKGKVAGLAVGATALAIGVIAAAAPAGSAVTKSAASAAASTPTIVIKPGVIHPMAGMSAPSQANCVALGFYHCITPQQVETAYNLAPLYRHGITGKSETS